MTNVIGMDNFNENKILVGREWTSVSKNGTGYGKMQIKYENKKFLFHLPMCKTLGVQTTEMDNGYVRKTMPLIFNDPKTRDQERFEQIFEKICHRLSNILYEKGYDDERMPKLNSCFWRNRVLYTTVVESFMEYENNTRIFVGNDEVKNLKEGDEYDANVVILIDSIYVGEKTISIQVKLYEAALTLSKKRDRVLA